jgi:Kdo2-lipid IVA lauroyltransferase/acyltransferase
LKDKLYFVAFYAFKAIIKALPLLLVKAILKLISHIAYRTLSKQKRVIFANLDMAFEDRMSADQKENIALACFENIALYLADFVANQNLTKEELLAKSSIENPSVAQGLIEKYGKAVMVSAHFGNWELLPHTVAATHNHPMIAVGRELDAASLQDTLTKSREQMGVEVINKHGAMRKLVKALRDDKLVGILVDQNTADEEGILIDFFGKKARHTTVASVLARRFDIPIIPAYIFTDGAKSVLRYYEPIFVDKSENVDADIAKATQAQADALEKAILEDPKQWFWFHKRWKNQYEEIYS